MINSLSISIWFLDGVQVLQYNIKTETYTERIVIILSKIWILSLCPAWDSGLYIITKMAQFNFMKTGCNAATSFYASHQGTAVAKGIMYLSFQILWIQYLRKNFFECGTNVHLDSSINFWDFGGHNLKVKVTVTY